MKHTFELQDGLLLDGVAQKTCTVETLTAKDLLDAARQSEILMTTADGYQLVESPVEMTRQLLLRQVKSIGEVKVISANLLGQLSKVDLHLIQYELEKLDEAERKQMEELIDRGKSSAVSETAEKIADHSVS